MLWLTCSTEIVQASRPPERLARRSGGLIVFLLALCDVSARSRASVASLQR